MKEIKGFKEDMKGIKALQEDMKEIKGFKEDMKGIKALQEDMKGISEDMKELKMTNKTKMKNKVLFLIY